MRLPLPLLWALLVTSASAFAPVARPAGGRRVALSAASKLTEQDCGCDVPIHYSGEPPKNVDSLNLRQALREPIIYRTDGQPVRLDDTILDRSTNIVVFLRSLG